MSQVSKLPMETTEILSMQSAASEELFMEPNAEVEFSRPNIGIGFLLRYPPIFRLFTQDWQMLFKTSGRLVVSRRSS